MEEQFGTALSWLSKFIVLFISAVLIFWFIVFWLTWTVDKMVMSRAMSDVVEMVTEQGYVSEADIRRCVEDRFGSNTSIIPGSIQISGDSVLSPRYIGEPLFVDVSCKVNVMTRELTITGRADFPGSVNYNGGHAARGYLTINQASNATS